MPSQALAVASQRAWLGHARHKTLPRKEAPPRARRLSLPLAACLGWPSDLPAACLLGRRLPGLQRRGGRAQRWRCQQARCSRAGVDAADGDA